MARSPLGRTLVIANPAAHSGRGASGADFTESFLASYASATSGWEVLRTGAAGDATRMAAASGGFDSVLALGGDGVIHEVARGLMSPSPGRRPQLGVIPMGSGNDYARTLGMALNDPGAALAQLVRGQARPVEVGRVNATPFVQTLSFGLDAAIALDTTERRSRDSLQRGEALFVTSGLKVLSRAREGWACRVSFDDEPAAELDELVLALQVGPTYGGGFRICPGASPTDGLLDACYNVRRPSVPVLLALFGMARWGGHAASRAVRLRRFARARLDFETEPPCQVDGEPLRATHFDVEVVPAALKVIFPPARTGRDKGASDG